MSTNAGRRVSLLHLMALIALFGAVFAVYQEVEKRRPLNRAIRQLQVGNAQGRLQAINTLSGLGTRALPALPAVEAALNDPDAGVRQAAVDLLLSWKISSDALTLGVIDGEISHPPGWSRWDVLGRGNLRSTYLRGRPIPPEGIAKLERALHAPEDFVRQQARRLTSTLANDPAAKPKDWLPLMLFIAAEESPVPTPARFSRVSPTERLQAARWIRDHAPEGKAKLVELLLDDLNSEDTALVWVTASTLEGMSPENGQALQLLLGRLKSRDLAARMRAIMAIEALRPSSELIVEPIAAAMLDRDADVESFAVYDSPSNVSFEVDWAYGQVLQPIRMDVGYPSVQSLGAHLLQKIGPDAETGAAMALAKMLRESDTERVRLAAKGLGIIGEGAKVAIPALLMLVRDPGSGIPPSLPVYPFRADDYPSYQAIDSLVRIARPLTPEIITVLVGCLDGPDRISADRAAMALAECGSAAREAAPVLARMALPGNPTTLRTTALRTIGKVGADTKLAGAVLLAAMQAHDWEVRIAAVSSIDCLGPGAQPYIPDLLLLIRGYPHSQYPRKQIAESLGTIGPPAAEAAATLRDISDDRDQFVREACAKALSRFFPDRAVLDSIVSQPSLSMDSSDPAIRALAAFEMGISPGTFTPELIDSLRHDPHLLVREAAARALGKTSSPLNAEEFEALTAALGDPAILVRMAAVDVLGIRCSGDARAVDAIVGMLESDPETQVRIQAVHALERVGTEQRPLVASALRKAVLLDREANVRDWSLFAIGGLSPPEDDLLETVIQATHDSAPNVRGAAVVALAKIGARGKADAVMPTILKSLGEVEWGYRYGLGSSLAAWKPSRPIVEALRECLSDEDPKVRTTAAVVLDGFPTAHLLTILPDLARALDDPEPEVRRTAAFTLRSLCRLAAPVEPALREAKNNDDRHVRRSAIDAVRAIDKNEQPFHRSS